MKYYGITDRGKLRKTNQDNYVIATSRNGDVFAMVCDGIGGGKGGDVASRLAISHFSINFSMHQGFENEDEVRAWVSHEVKACNTEIHELGVKNPDLKGMGTTLSGVMLTTQGKYIVNIGDSRTYGYYPDGSFKLLTSDHTLVNDMLKHGDLTPEEAETFPRKNVLTNALGVWDKTRFDLTRHREDISGFLICSDGLHGYVEENIIKNIVLDRTNDPPRRVRRLFAEAMNAGGFDNITAILIDLEGEEIHGGF